MDLRNTGFQPIKDQRKPFMFQAFPGQNMFGFRNNISTDDALINVTGKIINELDTGNKCLGIFLDLRKAFDTISHNLLLDKLHTIGVRARAEEDKDGDTEVSLSLSAACRRMEFVCVDFRELKFTIYDLFFSLYEANTTKH
ncbi:hypothetical protein ANN_05872 [Periplaneta americana]|uniref:Reverse transcriptase domain-containing protein n=1 Tax=Periplaneta americana TaxID=6978 RepID=A0ABQ8TCW8_PERAM|nr:hypothetical protein ANN_05872 [Periplaneta americana]